MVNGGTFYVRSITLLVFSISSIASYHGPLRKSAAQLENGCGQWRLDQSLHSGSGSLEAVLIISEPGEDCLGIVTFSNETDSLGLRGYSLELMPSAQNSNVRWRIRGHETDTDVIPPALDLEMYITPQDSMRSAVVNLRAVPTLQSFSADLSLIILRSGLELLPGGCPIPEGELSFMAIGSAGFLMDSSRLILMGNPLSARSELLDVLDAFYGRVQEVGLSIGVDCSLEFLMGNIEAQVKIGASYLSWVAVYIGEYITEAGELSSEFGLIYAIPEIVGEAPDLSGEDLGESILIGEWRGEFTRTFTTADGEYTRSALYDTIVIEYSPDTELLKLTAQEAGTDFLEKADLEYVNKSGYFCFRMYAGDATLWREFCLLPLDSNTLQYEGSGIDGDDIGILMRVNDSR